MITLQRHGPLIGILILGAVLYTYGLDWGIRSLRDFQVDGRQLSFAESGFHPDSNSLELATASLSKSIYPSIEQDGKTYLFSSYGPVYMYLAWGSAQVAGALLGFVPFGETVGDADATRIVGRAVSAAAGVVAIYLTFLLGLRAYGRTVGLLAALLLAVMPMAIQAAHFATVDGLLATGAVWICLQALGIDGEARSRDYILAGIAVGVTVAVKLNGALLASAIAIAHLQRGLATEDPIGQRLRGLVLNRHIWITAGCALAAYVILTPAAVFRFSDYFLTEFYGNIFHDVWVNIADLEGGREDLFQRGSLYLQGAPAYLYHFTHVLPMGIGWLLEATVVLGIFWAMYRHGRADLLLAGTVLVYSLVVGAFYDKPIRYFVVMGPLFAVLAARLLSDFGSLKGHAFRKAGLALTAIVCAHTAALGFGMASVYTGADARVEAARWLVKNAPTGSRVLVERGHNSLVSLLAGSGLVRYSMDVESEINSSRKAALVESGDYVARLYSEYLAPMDYLLISDDRMPMRRASRVAEEYYDLLFGGALGHELVASFELRPSVLGLEIDDSQSDLNLRRYDHPAAYVFRRTGAPRLFTERPDLAIYGFKTWQDCLAVLHRALEYDSRRIFQMVLPMELKKTLTPASIQEAFGQFKSNPDLLRIVSQTKTFIKEDGTVRLNLAIE
jgi:4-amino-4-deoxy-L-arabinose transferase-like glycosyltransferase